MPKPIDRRSKRHRLVECYREGSERARVAHHRRRRLFPVDLRKTTATLKSPDRVQPVPAGKAALAALSPGGSPINANLFGMFFFKTHHKNVILSGAPHGFIA